MSGGYTSAFLYAFMSYPFTYTSPMLIHSFVGRCSSDVIASAYGLDGPGIESRWGRDFPYLSRPAVRPTQSLVKCVPGLSRGEDAAGA